MDKKLIKIIGYVVGVLVAIWGLAETINYLRVIFGDNIAADSGGTLRLIIFAIVFILLFIAGVLMVMGVHKGDAKMLWPVIFVLVILLIVEIVMYIIYTYGTGHFAVHLIFCIILIIVILLIMKEMGGDITSPTLG